VTLPADTMAVVVGIEEYLTGKAWWLDGPALDACRFARWLTARGVPADRITLLVSPLPENVDDVETESMGYRYGAADHATVRDVFTQYLPRQRSGLLVLYWGGHGVIEQEERRLIYADATTLDKRNLNLSSLLKSMRSSTFAGHPQQLGLIDACLNLVEELRWEGTMPNEEFSVGRTEPWRDQRVLLAASPGERAVNVDGLKTGLFSQIVREALSILPADTWPPDADGLRDLVNERFEQLRNERRTRQVPSNMWYRSRSDDVLVFANGAQAGHASAAAVGGLLLTFAEYRKLKLILAGAPAPRELRALYREATRDVVGKAVPRQPDDLMSTVEALRNHLRPMPLFRFLVRFAAGSDGLTQHRLWEWINVIAPRWDVDTEELQALDMELRRTYVLLQLKPDLLEGGLLATGWTYEGSNGRQVVTTDEPWNRDRIAIEVSRLVGWFNPAHDSIPPVIEFLIPLPMLDDNLEALPVRIAGEDSEIGTACPVVIRSLDRLTDPDPNGREYWRARWKELTARGEAYDSEAICWVECTHVNGLFDPALLPTHICTALAYARPYGPHEDPVLLAVLSAGTPVALWHRGLSARKTRRAALEEVLCNRGLRELPDVVFSQRVAAHDPRAAADHAGRDLVLLWDDPDRVPPELEWQPPVPEGAAP